MEFHDHSFVIFEMLKLLLLIVLVIVHLLVFAELKRISSYCRENIMLVQKSYNAKKWRNLMELELCTKRKGDAIPHRKDDDDDSDYRAERE